MNIILLGQSGFPYGMAANRKFTMIAEGLVQTGNEVFFINREPVLDPSFHEKIPASGMINGVRYNYVTGSVYRNKSFVLRNLIRISSYYSEVKYIVKLNRIQKIDAAIIYDASFLRLFWYFILSRCFSFINVLHYVEFRSGISTGKFLYKMNASVFDRYAFYLLDGVFPISHFLADHITRVRSKLPQLMVPPITKFLEFDKVEKTVHDYLLFCGSADYYEIVEFIIHSFEHVNVEEMNLALVIHGTDENRKKLRSLIERSPKGDKISVFSNLSNNDLIEKYCHATALLIPLRDTLQDNARFPNKIAEYTASHRPIITTNYGEIPWHFKDGESAYIASEFEISSYCTAIEKCLTDSRKADDVGEKGYLVGKQNFDINSISGKIHNFLTRIQMKRKNRN